MVNNESLRRKDSYYPEYDAYTEVFDIDGLQDLLDRAIGWEKDNMIGKSGFKYIPDGKYSDFALNVFDLFHKTVVAGREMEKQRTNDIREADLMVIREKIDDLINQLQ